MLLLFELFSKERIKKIVFLLSTIFMFSILNISAIDSEKIKVAAKKIEEFGQKSLCFEKDFLNKYLQSNYNFGELFENKMYNYIFKKTSHIQDYGSCSENRALQKTNR